MYVNFCRSPLSSSRLVIHSLGFLVASSSLHLENVLLIIFLEAPVVGSCFLERFFHTSLAYPYLLDFFFYSSTI